jgi:hypothetical protein
MDYSQPQPPAQEKKSLTDHIGTAWSGLKGMFSDNSPPAPPTQTVGGRRKHRKTMKGGKRSTKRKSAKHHKRRKATRHYKNKRDTRK